MVDVDMTNPIAIVLSFFALTLTTMMFMLKMAGLGIFGVVGGLGIMLQSLWGNK